MQVKRVCSKCGNEYYVEQSDKYDICHTCYLKIPTNKELYKYMVKKEV